MELKEAASILRRDAYKAWIRQLNWRFMDERIEAEFNKCKLDSSSENELGKLYLSKEKNSSNKYCKLVSSQYINSTHIMTGTRSLNTFIYDVEKDSFVSACESNAQLWYSQGPSGNVLVFVGPYESDLGKIDENEIIIGRYKNPYQVNERVIKKHFSTLFKYCTCTSQYSASNFKPYLYRQYLIFNDFRFRLTYWQKMLRVAERVIIVALAAAAVLVSLYVGGKL